MTSTEKALHTGIELQLSVKNGSAGKRSAGRDPLTLDRLREGEEALLDRIELPEDDARRLMELGFLPGTMIQASHRSPFGDPRIFRVDGSEVALRRETAIHLFVRLNGAPSLEGL